MLRSSFFLIVLKTVRRAAPLLLHHQALTARHLPGSREELIKQITSMWRTIGSKPFTITIEQ